MEQARGLTVPLFEGITAAFNAKTRLGASQGRLFSFFDPSLTYVSTRKLTLTLG